MPYFDKIPKERNEIIDFYRKSEELFEAAKTEGDEDFFSYIQSVNQSSNEGEKQ